MISIKNTSKAHSFISIKSMVFYTESAINHDCKSVNPNPNFTVENLNFKF